jgi:hypothetical protein
MLHKKKTNTHTRKRRCALSSTLFNEHLPRFLATTCLTLLVPTKVLTSPQRQVLRMKKYGSKRAASRLSAGSFHVREEHKGSKVREHHPE